MTRQLILKEFKELLKEYAELLPLASDLEISGSEVTIDKFLSKLERIENQQAKVKRKVTFLKFCITNKINK